MVGGGPHLSPGEITLADQGVLFLDELPEFDRDVLEALRQPLEEGRVAIARAGRATIFPARFQLVAAMNPCPCGFAGTLGPRRADARRCVPERYQRRVSGPLRDRIDLWIAMPRVAAARPRPGGRAGGLGGRRRADRRRRGRSPPARPVGRRSTAGSPAGPCARRAASTRGRGAARRRARRAGAGERTRHGTAAAGRADDRRPRRATTSSSEAHLDEAAWFRPADLRLAAAEVS